MPERPHQNLAIIGHVDHGESTLVGRLLYETESVPEYVIEQHEEEAEEENPDFVQADDAAIVTVRPQKPLSIEPASEIPELGSFAIRDMGQTVAAGQVVNVEER